MRKIGKFLIRFRLVNDSNNVRSAERKKTKEKYFRNKNIQKCSRSARTDLSKLTKMRKIKLQYEGKLWIASLTSIVL